MVQPCSSRHTVDAASTVQRTHEVCATMALLPAIRWTRGVAVGMFIHDRHAVEYLLHHHEKQRDKENPQKSTRQHAAKYAGPDGALRAGTRAGGNRQRQHTQP